MNKKYPHNKNRKKLKVKLLRKDSILVFFISIKDFAYLTLPHLLYQGKLEYPAFFVYRIV
jgi:hypothetical protein